MTTTDHKLRVFLCHASEDKPIVREIYSALLAQGWIEPWLDEEKLLPGQNWQFEIENAVEGTDVVIVCISGRSVTKEGYVQHELRIVLDIALEKPEGTIFVIPVRLDDCELPHRLRELHFVDYFPEKKKKAAIQRLLGSLKVRSKNLSIRASRPPESDQAAAPKPASQDLSRLSLAELQQVIEGEQPRNATKLSADRLQTERQQQAFAVLSRRKEAEASAYLRQLAPAGMVLIPAGDFPLGSGRYPNESPQTTVWVNSFYMSRFPVTNGEYRLFMIDGGYSRLECWTRAGWNWVQTNRKSSPWRWTSECWQAKVNHPVDWISWYEAMAYARWMALRTGALYRLPTEAEWEKAAGWDEHAGRKREYPWGDRFDNSLCNLGNSNGTLPVGSFSPAGDSYWGISDMVGQIWQWTNSLRKPYPYQALDGREDPEALGERTFRGGCWANHDAGFVRCESRYVADRPIWPDMNTNGEYEGPCGLRLVLGCADWLEKKAE